MGMLWFVGFIDSNDTVSFAYEKNDTKRIGRTICGY